MAEYGEVTWMADALRESFGTFAANWWIRLQGLLLSAGRQAVPLGVILIAVTALALANRKARDLSPEFWRLMAAAILVSAVAAVFYACVGLVRFRLAFSLLPAMIAVTAAAALSVTARHESQRLKLALCCAAVAVLAAIYIVVKDGPYS